jgi:hypothetical protein
MPPYAIALAGGIFFIVMGIFSYTRKEGAPGSGWGAGASLQAFGLVFLAEMGDKTQLTALTLTATFGSPCWFLPEPCWARPSITGWPPSWEAATCPCSSQVSENRHPAGLFVFRIYGPPDPLTPAWRPGREIIFPT